MNRPCRILHKAIEGKRLREKLPLVAPGGRTIARDHCRRGALEGVPQGGGGRGWDARAARWGPLAASGALANARACDPGAMHGSANPGSSWVRTPPWVCFQSWESRSIKMIRSSKVQRNGEGGMHERPAGARSRSVGARRAVPPTLLGRAELGTRPIRANPGTSWVRSPPWVCFQSWESRWKKIRWLSKG